MERGSQVWNAILDNRDIIEEFIWWEARGRTSILWFDNCTNTGPLFKQQY